jgi:hypothetical protein
MLGAKDNHMAFCTKCGASLDGASCNQCGAPSAQAAQPAAAAVTRRKTSPFVWVLVVIACVFGLGLMAVLGAGAFFVHKARQAGVDGDLFRDNPGLAVGKMMAAVNRNLEVVRTNEAEGTVILRDRHSGKQFSINIDAARHGSFTLKAADEDGKGGSLEIGRDARIAVWVPQYPGSHPEATFSAKGESSDGVGEAGNFNFQTDDPPSKVLSFYEEKARELGMTLHSVGAGGTTLSAGDDETHRFLKVIVNGSSGETTVNVTYGRKH